MPGYSLFDASFGAAHDNWIEQVVGQNLSNENASVSTSSAQFIKSEVPLRPRALGPLGGPPRRGPDAPCLG